MKPEKQVRSLRFTMKGPALVETKSKNKVVNIKSKKGDTGRIWNKLRYLLREVNKKQKTGKT